MSGDRKRRAVFAMYAANLSACFPAVKNMFLCPFCKKPFGQEALDEDPPRLVIAHCTPKKLKGRLTTMACASCDNEAGRIVEVHLKNRFETEVFSRGESPTPSRVWLTVAGQRVRAEFEITKGDDGKPVYSLYVDEKYSNPTAYEEMVKALENGEAFKTVPTILAEGRMNFDMEISRVAMLRSAFLMMFRHFGYSYILNKNLNRVREQILNPGLSIIPGKPVIQLESESPFLDCVGVITAPEALKSFIVPMLFQTDSKSKVPMAVLMPGLGKDGDSIYERAQEEQAKNENFRADCRLFKYDPGRLSNPESIYLPFRIWRTRNVLEGPLAT
jgi:hypothetical protein